jgi:hypothetical protein
MVTRENEANPSFHRVSTGYDTRENEIREIVIRGCEIRANNKIGEKKYEET